MLRQCRALFTGALVMAGAVALAGQAAAENVLVEVDRAKVLRLDQPAATVIVGNPSIADALVQDSATLVVTGKSFGATNLLVLDETGKTLAEKTLRVRAADDHGTVTVQRGTARMSLSCAPVCQRTLAVGDTPESYDTLNAQIQNRLSLSEGEAGP